MAHEEKLFSDLSVTPAIRANDTTDVWVGRGAKYRQSPSCAFASCYLDEVQFGSLAAPREGKAVVNLALHSITFTNDAAVDLTNLETCRSFRAEAERKGFRYFLEVFDPNTDAGLADEEIPVLGAGRARRPLSAFQK